MKPAARHTSSTENHVRPLSRMSSSVASINRARVLVRRRVVRASVTFTANSPPSDSIHSVLNAYRIESSMHRDGKPGGTP